MNGDFENFKEQVRSTADMVEIISGYVPLKERPELLGLLPVSRRKKHRPFRNPRQEHVLLLWLP